MRSAILISAAMSLVLAGAASAQTTELDDDRFKPRVYGNLGVVTPAYQTGTIEIYDEMPTTSTTTITRIVEPVAPSVDTVITAPITYDDQGVVKAQHFKQGDLTDAQYQALLEEADRVRTYQGGSTTTYSYPTESDSAQSYGTSTSYEIDLYQDAPATIETGAPVTIKSTPSLMSHTVIKGDTLYNISKRYNTSVAAIQDANGLSGTNIGLGQTLAIPSATIPAQSLNTTLAQPTFASAPVQQGYVTRRVVQPVSTYATPTSYAVLKSDTIYGISRRTCLSPAALIQANNLANPNQLTPGQMLTLPSGHCLTK